MTSSDSRPRLPKEAFYLNQAGEEVPCDGVRFAVGDKEGGIKSAVWSAMNSKARNSTDMFMTTEGLSADAKVSFHARDAIVAYKSERMTSLIVRGLIGPEASRQTTLVPILSEPFVVASIAFFPGVMKSAEKWRPAPKKPMTLIEPPPLDLMLRVHVVHSFDEPAELHDQPSDQQLRWFARLRSGNRNLTFFRVTYPIDWKKEHATLRGHVEQIPAREDLVKLAESKDLSALFWGADSTYLNFFEIHGLAVKE